MADNRHFVEYARWAKVFNLKQMAKALMFMEEHGIKSYEELTEKANGILEQREQLLNSIKADEVRLQEIQIMKKHLLNYRKSQDVFQKYKASGYNRKFYEEHRDVLSWITFLIWGVRKPGKLSLRIQTK